MPGAGNFLLAKYEEGAWFELQDELQEIPLMYVIVSFAANHYNKKPLNLRTVRVFIQTFLNKVYNNFCLKLILFTKI
jgi:hypothetical protein